LNYLNESTAEEVMKLFIKHCIQLKWIEFSFNSITEQTLKLFGETFGQKLLHIKASDYWYYNSGHNRVEVLLRLCPNLVSINHFYINQLSFINTNELLLQKTDKNWINI
jgi:hypothetical protein